LFEHSHDSYNTRLPAGGEGMKFEVGGDEGSSKFCIGCSAGTGAEDGRRDVVKFFAVLWAENASVKDGGR